MSARTILVLDCINCLTNLCILLKEKLQLCGGEDVLVPALLKISASIKKVVSSAATETLKQICGYMNEGRVLQQLHIAINEKNSPVLRLRAIQALSSLIDIRGYSAGQITGNPLLFGILVKGSSDPDPEVRLEAAILIEEHRKGDSRHLKETLLDKLDSNCRKQLWRTIERYNKSKEIGGCKENTTITTPNKQNFTGIDVLDRIITPIKKLPPFIGRPSSIIKEPARQESSGKDGNEIQLKTLHEGPKDFKEESLEENTKNEDMVLEQAEKEIHDMNIEKEDQASQEDMPEIEEVSQAEDMLIDISDDPEIIIKVLKNVSIFSSSSVPMTNFESHELDDKQHAAKSPQLPSSSSVYTTPVKSASSSLQATPQNQVNSVKQVTPKSVNKVPLRVRLGLATCSPYQQQLTAIELSTPTKHQIPLEQLLGCGEEKVNLQKLSLSIDNSKSITSEQFQQILQIIKNACIESTLSDSTYLAIARTMASLLIKGEFMDMDLLRLLEILFLKNPFLFKELIRGDLLNGFSHAILSEFLREREVLNAFRGICFVKYISCSPCTPTQIVSDFAELLKRSLNDPLISTRQASASCFKALIKVLTIEEIINCFNDRDSTRLTTLERKLLETYCRI